MRALYLVCGGSALIALTLAGLGGWMLSLPAATSTADAPPAPQAEADAMLASLTPPTRRRPLVAVVGINDATETTDYLMPTGILRRADVADVVMLATGEGPVQLFPALRVLADATLAEFDRAHPEGADYVIVPAMSRDDDPAALGWLIAQAKKGARIIGICAGAKVLASAGLLPGKRATTHWYYLREMLKRDPTIEYVADRRMVADGAVTTTTGITASMPMMLTLIEAIAGRTRANAVAADLGLATWDARHRSDAFQLTRPFAATVLANRLAFWSRERLGVRLEEGFDEVSVALVADAWSRTYRSRGLTYAGSGDAVGSRNGVQIIPDVTSVDWPQERRASAAGPPAEVLDRTLAAIETRYGDQTANVVAMQLEYPRSEAE